MSRPKGSKNKPKVESPINEKGNPAFNLKDAEPLDILEATNVVTEEDRALDRELERMARETVIPDLEPEPPNTQITKEKSLNTLLSEFVDDYKPAETINDLQDQVYMAKQYGADSIECTLGIARRYVKDKSLEDVGYFMFNDLKVFLVGHFERAVKRDARTTWDIETKR